MAWKAICNLGLAFCLILQATAPCCCAFQSDPSESNSCCGHCDECPCPASTPADCPSSDCSVCSVLGQVFDSLGSNNERTDCRVLAARPFQASPASREEGHVPFLGPAWDTTPRCDIYAMQTLRE
jgi:hypothetical protein